MEKFTKQIVVDNKAKLFEFTKLKNVNGVKFFVTSEDENKKPISFSLRQVKGNDWKLTPGSLRWLYQIEAELSDAIIGTRLQ